MPYKTIFGDIFENEFDEEMTRKFPQTYKVLKNIYPDAYKLPKDEIKTMSQMLRSQGETLDDATGLVQSYIKKNEPVWKLDYFDDKKPEQSVQGFGNTNYGKEQSLQPYPNTMKPVEVKPAQMELNADNRDDAIINRFYEHLKDDQVEGYYQHPYCDSVGKPTTGAGLMLPNRQALDNFTMTRQNAPVSESNPALTPQQKDDYWQKQTQYCNSFYRGKDKNDKDLWDSISAKKQLEKYPERYNEGLPYFQDNELENQTKKYIRKEVLNPLVNRLNTHKIDFYNDLNDNGQIGVMDVRYNLGPNRFKLCTDFSDSQCWPSFTTALINRDFDEAAKQSHRLGISPKRNEMIYGYIKNGQRK